jgi:hypothetical protein
MDIQSPQNGPFSAQEVVPVLWVFAVSLLGGLASWVRKVRSGQSSVFNFMELVGELATAALVGLITYWACKAFALNQYATAAIIGVCSHMGTRLVMILEFWVKSRAPRLLDKATGLGPESERK